MVGVRVQISQPDEEIRRAVRTIYTVSTTVYILKLQPVQHQHQPRGNMDPFKFGVMRVEALHDPHAATDRLKR